MKTLDNKLYNKTFDSFLTLLILCIQIISDASKGNVPRKCRKTSQVIGAAEIFLKVIFTFEITEVVL